MIIKSYWIPGLGFGTVRAILYTRQDERNTRRKLKKHTQSTFEIRKKKIAYEQSGDVCVSSIKKKKKRKQKLNVCTLLLTLVYFRWFWDFFSANKKRERRWRMLKRVFGILLCDRELGVLTLLFFCEAKVNKWKMDRSNYKIIWEPYTQKRGEEKNKRSLV